MGMPSGPFSFVDYYTSQAEYMALLNSLMLSANKSVTLGVGDNSWMDVNVWTKVMGTFWTNFEKKLADPAYLDERSVFKGLSQSSICALFFIRLSKDGTYFGMVLSVRPSVHNCL